MKYGMLLHFPDTYMGADWEPAEIEAHQREYQAYKGRLREEGVFHAGEALQPQDITTTVTFGTRTQS